MARGIVAPWSIRLDGGRTAKVGDLLLIVAKPVKGVDLRWAIFLTDGEERVLMQEGASRWAAPNPRYQAHVQQAMFEVEQAAAALS